MAFSFSAEGVGFCSGIKNEGASLRYCLGRRPDIQLPEAGHPPTAVKRVQE
jgi:hypothetical protein